MKAAPFILGVLCFASCCSVPQKQDSGLPAFDPFTYVAMPKDPSEFRLAVRRLNSEPGDASRTGITEPASSTLEKLGLPGFAFLAEEIRQRGVRSAEATLYIFNNVGHRGEPLLSAALFESLLKAKKEAGADRIERETHLLGTFALKKPEDQLLYFYVKIFADLGRNAVPFLCECLRSGGLTVRQAAWDLLNIVAFQQSGEMVYQLALESANKESSDWNRAADHFLRWWDGNREKLGWNPQSYSFKSP